MAYIRILLIDFIRMSSIYDSDANLYAIRFVLLLWIQIYVVAI